MNRKGFTPTPMRNRKRLEVVGGGSMRSKNRHANGANGQGVSMLRNSSLVWGFTLLELLIVIAILAVLATVAVLVINPLEYLKQSRDAKRIGDMAALNKALGLAEFENVSLGGASTTVFVSLLDTTSTTCGALGLPALPTGYQYHCVSTSTDLRKTDGNGWIPVNLGLIAGGSPLAALPVDPMNTISERAYYTYVPGGSFELTATLESDKYAKEKAMDGGLDPARFETGSNLTLSPFIGGLIGYWDFEEGSGVMVFDRSNAGNSGTWNGTSTVRYGAGKVGSYAGVFNGSSDYVNMVNPAYNPNQITMAAWIKIAGGGTHSAIVQTGNTLFSGSGTMIKFWPDTSNYAPQGNGSLSGVWHYVAVTWDYVLKKGGMYIDGVKVMAISDASPTQRVWSTLRLGMWSAVPYFTGEMDEVRVYNRALTEAEIKALYNATK